MWVPSLSSLEIMSSDCPAPQLPRKSCSILVLPVSAAKTRCGSCWIILSDNLRETRAEFLLALSACIKICACVADMEVSLRLSMVRVVFTDRALVIAAIPAGRMVMSARCSCWRVVFPARWLPIEVISLSLSAVPLRSSFSRDLLVLRSAWMASIPTPVRVV